MAQSSLPVCCLNGVLILLVIGVPTIRSGQPLENESVDPDNLAHHGNILTPLLKALSDQEPWGVYAPRTRPDSRYVRFMKRLYKLSSKQERSHEASHLYNTVRLITPRQECLDQNTEFFMQDISYSLDRVRAQERLLKSVLLYSVNHNHAASLASICYLQVKEQVSPDNTLCFCLPRPPSHARPVSLRMHSKRAGRRWWVEVDVTSFLHPVIQSHRKDIHLFINLTCLVDSHPVGDGHAPRSPVKLHMAPSLLLYLNDTSEVAYQRGPTPRRSTAVSLNPWDEISLQPVQQGWRSGPVRQTWRERRSPPNGTQAPGPSLDGSLLDLPPTDDCDLYDFRVSFSQLKLDHWIIAPHKYNPRYCKGICPRVVGYIYGSPVHTMVQNIIYEKLDSSVPRPSCVPSEYDPLSVLTIENDGSIAYKEYEEMIATKCTCR
ncbi:growth/differentiatio [Brachyhypopomus gauderio]|uniref:growth/differentiatio n=1 Tax=Brachyhypopomus gauderio TaxID=698409 RepID=UPI0040416AD0